MFLNLKNYIINAIIYIYLGVQYYYKYNVIKAIMIFLNYEYGVNILHKKYRFVSTYKNVIYTFKINLEETMFFERMEEPLNLDS